MHLDGPAAQEAAWTPFAPSKGRGAREPMRLVAEVENPPALQSPTGRSSLADPVLFRVDATSHRIGLVLRNRLHQTWFLCGAAFVRELGTNQSSSDLPRVMKKVD
jgi:hypothetical protein